MINSQKDPFLKSREVSLIDMCKNPSKKKKEDLEQWMFIDLIDPIQIRRNLLNYNKCHALIIEFDNKEGPYVSIDEFAKKYEHLEWILHTTSSHTAQVNKFRVILPLDVPVEYGTWRNVHVKEEMKLYFEGIDPSSFSNFQKIPAYPSNKSEYRYLLNRGVKFSYSMIRDAVLARVEEEKVKEQSRLQKIANIPIDREFNYEAYKEKVIDNLTKKYGGCGARETGHRYTDLCSYCGSMTNAKYPDGSYIFDDPEILSAIKQECNQPNVMKMARTFCRNRK